MVTQPTQTTPRATPTAPSLPPRHPCAHHGSTAVQRVLVASPRFHFLNRTPLHHPHVTRPSSLLPPGQESALPVAEHPTSYQPPCQNARLLHANALHHLTSIRQSSQWLPALLATSARTPRCVKRHVWHSSPPLSTLSANTSHSGSSPPSGTPSANTSTHHCSRLRPPQAPSPTQHRNSSRR